MAPNPTIMQAVEHLGYRVTVGDVATQAGLNVNLAQQGLLTLATDAGGHLQVVWRNRLPVSKTSGRFYVTSSCGCGCKNGGKKVWRVLFYLIRISFGIILLASLYANSSLLIITTTNRDE